ncbi:MAG: hypothetical protein LBC94_01200 [Desulfovibrio sp.]|nr:hypothetical protein [Desulfovibrio sp.]
MKYAFAACHRPNLVFILSVTAPDSAIAASLFDMLLTIPEIVRIGKTETPHIKDIPQTKEDS